VETITKREAIARHTIVGAKRAFASFRRTKKAERRSWGRTTVTLKPIDVAAGLITLRNTNPLLLCTTLASVVAAGRVGLTKVNHD
jgi:hypothetical protein